MHVSVVQLGPELELSGYGCEDHFQELDTVEHCWECISGVSCASTSTHAMMMRTIETQNS